MECALLGLNLLATGNVAVRQGIQIHGIPLMDPALRYCHHNHNWRFYPPLSTRSQALGLVLLQVPQHGF